MNIAETPPDQDVLKLIPYETAKKYLAFPLRIVGDTLWITMAEPTNFFEVEELKNAVNMELDVCVSAATDIITAYKIYYKIDEEEYNSYSYQEKDQYESDYAGVIDKTAAMVLDRKARKLAMQRGLYIQDVSWEDTGRYKNSCVGPNISDMTIQVQERYPRIGEYRLTCMPVIRTPNFADISADVPLDSFSLLVGNEKGQPLKKVTLRELLGNLREYLTESNSWKGKGTSLLADRDTHALVSAQACFLPIPKQGKAEFNPVLFNYQSRADAPAVLAILATPEGTSTTVIDNTRDGFKAGQTWGQRLFFNQAGERASLTGERISDFLGNRKAEGATISEGESQGLNIVLLIQVPLKQVARVEKVIGPVQVNREANQRRWIVRVEAGEPLLDQALRHVVAAFKERFPGQASGGGPFCADDHLEGWM